MIDFEETNCMREDAGMQPVNKLAISFSGGRTSAVMTKRLVESLRGTDTRIVITFANTGLEHPATLDFIHKCDFAFDLGVVWLEAVVDPRRGQGIRHKVVTYDTAARNGEPFEAVVAKHGIFNQTAKSCTTKLKELVMRSYLQSVGYRFGKRKDHDTAIGIRADEMDRVDPKFRWPENKFIYPMVDWGMRKRDVALLPWCPPSGTDQTGPRHHSQTRLLKLRSTFARRCLCCPTPELNCRAPRSRHER